MSALPPFENPYRPPGVIEPAPQLELQLDFAGEITRQDYKKMLPTTTEVFLVRTLMGLCLACVLPIVIATPAMFLATNRGFEVGVLAGSLLISLALLGAVYLVSPWARMNRYLRANPDLLGTARGYFGQEGLVFDDGTCTHWFSWQALPRVLPRVLPRIDGIRVALEANPARFLALSERIFTPYCREHAEGLVRAFAGKPATLDELQLACCSVFGRSRQEARFFSGWVASRQTFRSADVLKNVAIQSISGVALISLPSRGSGMWKWLMPIMGIYCLIIAVQHLWQYFFGFRIVNQFSWGWLDQNSVIYALDSTSSRLRYTYFRRIRIESQHVELEMNSGRTIRIFAEHFNSSANWSELVHALPTISPTSLPHSKNQNRHQAPRG